MLTETAELLSQLDSALSRDEGFALLRSYPPGLSYELADTLSARSKDFKTAGETVLSEDFSAWASEARSLVTVQLAMSAKDDAARLDFLRTQRNRFDDPFFDLCFRITSARIRGIYEMLEAPDDARPEPALSTFSKTCYCKTVWRRFRKRRP